MLLELHCDRTVAGHQSVRSGLTTTHSLTHLVRERLNLDSLVIDESVKDLRCSCQPPASCGVNVWHLVGLKVDPMVQCLEKIPPRTTHGVLSASVRVSVSEWSERMSDGVNS